MKKSYLFVITFSLSCLAHTQDLSKPSVVLAAIPTRLREWLLLLIPIAIGLLAIGAGFIFLRYRTLRHNRQLQAEKEWLVKELHHRVKNNLQLVMSLLNTQSHYLENEKAQAAIGQSRNRMYALSLIHQRLYQPGDLERIDMKMYVPDLIQHLHDSFPDQHHISFHLDIDAAPLDVAIAVPIGLILNESISNSLQWAFPGDRPGAVRILLRQQQGLFLEIADDGIGLPPDHESRRQQSMGFQLMGTLVQQLEGAIIITGDNGTRVSIRIPDT
jgi:two-component sensor histidine kinase